MRTVPDVRQSYSSRVCVLILVDCLVILDIIRKWGHSDFHPSPREIVHFAVIYPLLLRQWLGKVTLVKVKSHAGCLLNEHADELAKLGRQAKGPKICPGPPKVGYEFDLQRESLLSAAPNPYR